MSACNCTWSTFEPRLMLTSSLYSIYRCREGTQMICNTLLVSSVLYQPSRGRRYGNGWHLDEGRGKAASRANGGVYIEPLPVYRRSARTDYPSSQHRQVSISSAAAISTSSSFRCCSSRRLRAEGDCRRLLVRRRAPSKGALSHDNLPYRSKLPSRTGTLLLVVLPKTTDIC